MGASAAVRRESIFMPFLFIQQLRSRKTPEPGTGNLKTLRAIGQALKRVGAKAACLGPIFERSRGLASPFSRSSLFAIDRTIVDILDIPEIKNNRRLREKAEKELNSLNARTQGSRQNLELAEATVEKYFETAFRIFQFSSLGLEREQEFSGFCEEHAAWLDKYAYFKVLQERFGHIPIEQLDPEYRDFNSDKAQEFMRDQGNLARMKYHKYVQMEMYRQVKETIAYLKSLGINELEILAPVGVDRVSAEVFLNPRLYDLLRQIGCFAEPENGFGIQLWGIAAEIEDPEILKELVELLAASFKQLRELGITRNSFDHACGRLGGYTTFDIFVFEGCVEKSAFACFGEKQAAILAALADREYAQTQQDVVAVQFNGRRETFRLRGAKGLEDLSEQEETRVYELLMKNGTFRRLKADLAKDAEIAEKSGRWMFDPRGIVERGEVEAIFGPEDTSWHQFFINPKNFLGNDITFRAKVKDGNQECSIEEYIGRKVADGNKRAALLGMLGKAKQEVEAKRAKYAEDSLFMILDIMKDAAFSAETVGDFARRVAAERAIGKAIERSYDITLMRGLPYEKNHFTAGALPLAKFDESNELRPFANKILGALAQEGYIANEAKNREALILDKLYSTKRENFDLPSLDFADQNRGEMLNKIWFLLQEFRSYGPADRLSVTHDMYAFLSHLTGFVGAERLDWMFDNNARHVRHFLNRLGALTAGQTTPLDVKKITPEFMFELLLRARAGSDAGTFVTTEPSLHHTRPGHILNSTRYCVNVMPGTDGGSNNERGNWLQRSDYFENLTGAFLLSDLSRVTTNNLRQQAIWQALETQGLIGIEDNYAVTSSTFDSSLEQFTLKEISLSLFEKQQLWNLLKESQTQFSRFHALVNTTGRYFGNATDISSDNGDTRFQAQVKQVKSESVAYQAADGNWTVWQPSEKIKPILEMAVAYTGPEVTAGHENKAWATFNLSAFSDRLADDQQYDLHDLVTGQTFTASGKSLRENGLTVGLNTQTSRHHFVVYSHTENIPAQT